MNGELSIWLLKKIELSGLHYRELARRAGVSHTLISRVLSGNMKASPEFCIKIAAALGEPPEKLLRLAGLIPPSSDPNALEQTLEDLIDIVEHMSPENQQDILDYARYRFWQQERKKGQD